MKNTELSTLLWKQLKGELQIDKEKLWKKKVFYPIIMHFLIKYTCIFSSLICINTKLNVLFGCRKTVLLSVVKFMLSIRCDL